MSMKHFINKRIMAISGVAIVMTAIFCTFAYYTVFRGEILNHLKICSRLLSKTSLLDHTEELARYAAELDDDGIRMTLIQEDGTVVFDNIVNPEGLGNHRNRTEIEEALQDGEGYAVRLSETIKRTNYYFAVRLEDGSVLRTARESHSIFNIFLHAVPMIILAVILLLIICYFNGRMLTKKLLEPIEAIAGNMNCPVQIRTYEELEPIIAYIRNQHDSIIANANLRQEFTANVSHELKTPLASISGYAELIENGLAGEQEIRKFSGEIRKSSNRLLVLINDILRLSEFDATGKNLLKLEPVDLYSIAETCVEMLEVSAKEHGVSIAIEGEASVISADKDMVEEVLYNLCDNAIRYNRPGGHVKVTVREGVLTVADDGIGIPEEYQPRIFERFFRVDKSRSKKTGGTGLGLAIVKHIATLHDAELTMTSNPGEGTAVSVRFRVG